MRKVLTQLLRSIFQPDVLIAVGLALFLAGLPFHLVIKKLAPGPLGDYWKEFLLALLVGVWAIRCLAARRLALSDTPLDLAGLIYLGLLVLRFILDRSGWVGAWGLYVSVMYLPLFWLVPVALHRHPRWIVGLVVLLVGVGTLVALGGLAEFALNKSLWPSEEMVLRQGFPDVFIYGTHVRRVYFTFDSPTTLANTLGLLLPLALALALLARRWWLRLGSGLATVVIAACILVTFSRGMWVAVAMALAAMGAWGVLPHLVSGGRTRRVWGGLAAGVIVVGLVWGGITVAARFSQSPPMSVGVVELSPQAYKAAPAILYSPELLRVRPEHGEYVTQTWTIFDSIAGQADTRTVLYEHPPESGKVEIIYRVTVPAEGALRFAVALSPEVWSPEKGDGASFQVYVAEPDTAQAGQFVFVRYVNPKNNPGDRRWRNFLVDLSP
jgi:hypothetical protein